MFHQRYEPPPRNDIPGGGYEWASVSFDLLNMYEIVNPPSMIMTTLSPEYDSFLYGDTERSLMSRDETTECDVVWYERPGELWHELPGNTCEPGHYEIRMVERNSPERDTLSTRNRISMGMPTLSYGPGAPASQAYHMARIEVARRVASAVQPLHPGEHADEFSMTPLLEQLALAAQIPPADIQRELSTIGNPMPGPELPDQLAQIWESMREYGRANRQRPAAIIMNQQDWELLRRDAMIRQDDTTRRAFDDRARPFDSLFGLEIRPERNMPRGRVLVVGNEMMWNPASARPGVGFGIFDSALLNEPYVAPPPPKSAVLPESELIDEIDRLVNESVKVGPVDDYSVNRYPKCPHCGHQWHGIMCEATSTCDCLGELEDPV